MANTFLAAQGYDMAESLVEKESVEIARKILERSGERLLLPLDLVVGDQFSADAAMRVVSVDGVPEGWRALDIGPATVEVFAQTINSAKLVVWNGPMGVFEFEPFAEGTWAARSVARRHSCH